MAKETQVDEFTNIPQALNTALEKEKASYAFYMQGIARVSDAGVKTLFRELAVEEKNHILRIQALIDKEIMREM
jgi:rubrerythrin